MTVGNCWVEFAVVIMALRLSWELQGASSSLTKLSDEIILVTVCFP
jgi:hypothetical protein